MRVRWCTRSARPAKTTTKTADPARPATTGAPVKCWSCPGGQDIVRQPRRSCPAPVVVIHRRPGRLAGALPCSVCRVGQGIIQLVEIRVEVDIPIGVDLAGGSDLKQQSHDPPPSPHTRCPCPTYTPRRGRAVTGITRGPDAAHSSPVLRTGGPRIDARPGWHGGRPRPAAGATRVARRRKKNPARGAVRSPGSRRSHRALRIARLAACYRVRYSRSISSGGSCAPSCPAIVRWPSCGASS